MVKHAKRDPKRDRSAGGKSWGNRAHPGVSLVEIQGKGWVARWKDPATGKQTQTAFSKLQLTNERQRVAWAKAKSEELREAKKKGGMGISASVIGMSPRDLVDRYLATPGEDWRPGTKPPKRVDLGLVADWCEQNGVKHLGKLTGQKLTELRGWLVASEWARSTRNRRLVNLGIWLRWARDLGATSLTNEQIRKGCKRLKVDDGAPQFFRPEQVQQILEGCIEHDRDRPPNMRRAAPFVLALLLTGARYDEVASLSWPEVNFDEECIDLPASRVKTGKWRQIEFDVTPWLGKLLRALYATRKDEPGPFDWPSNAAWSSRLERIRKHYGLPRELTAHALRRTHASLMISAPRVYGSASLFRSCKRLGHSASEAESKYACDVKGLNDGRTFEEVAGIEEHCQTIVAMIEELRP